MQTFSLVDLTLINIFKLYCTSDLSSLNVILLATKPNIESVFLNENF